MNEQTLLSISIALRVRLHKDAKMRCCSAVYFVWKLSGSVRFDPTLNEWPDGVVSQHLVEIVYGIVAVVPNAHVLDNVKRHFREEFGPHILIPHLCFISNPTVEHRRGSNSDLGSCHAEAQSSIGVARLLANYTPFTVVARLEVRRFFRTQ